MTFKERYITEANGVNNIADLKELADYHSKSKELFNKSAPFMNPKERQTVSDNQNELNQSIDQKWSDRFNNHTPEPEPAQTPTPVIGNDLTSGLPDIDSVNGPVAGLADMFG